MLYKMVTKRKLLKQLQKNKNKKSDSSDIILFSERTGSELKVLSLIGRTAAGTSVRRRDGQ